CSLAILIILSTGPTRTGTIRSSFQASTAAVSDDSSQGCATAVSGDSSTLHFWTKFSYLLNVLTIISGPSVRSTDIFSRGAITAAVPVITVSPSPFTHTQSKSTFPVSSSFEATFIVSVIVSPDAMRF